MARDVKKGEDVPYREAPEGKVQRPVPCVSHLNVSGKEAGSGGVEELRTGRQELGWSHLEKNSLACVGWDSPGSCSLSPSKIKLLQLRRAGNPELSEAYSK